jgi:signal transduction histidine kinase
LVFSQIPLEGSPGSGVFLKDYLYLPGKGQRLLCYAGLPDGSGIALGISPESIDRIMLENDPLSGLGYSGESYLVGPDGLMRSSSRFQEGAILQTRVQTQAVAAAREGKEGTGIIRDYRGIDVLSAYAPAGIPGLDWLVLAELDLEETIAPLKALRDSLIGISILISLVMFVIAWFTARRISRPLRRFGEAVEEMSRGNLAVNVEHSGKDEVGKLAESFNRMAEQLRENQDRLNREQLRQVELTLDGQEKERQRLSRELHDGLGQHLIAVKLKLEQITPENTCEAFRGIKEVRQAIDQTIDEIRNISNDLMPSSLEAFGLSNALRKLCQDTAQDTGLDIHTHLDKPALKPGSQASLYLYRIAQEALHNIVKHAGAGKVWLSLRTGEKQIILEVKDNGIGIDENSAGMGQGQGLANIRERIKILKGEMDLRKLSEGGTLLRIKIPADES